MATEEPLHIQRLTWTGKGHSVKVTGEYSSWKTQEELERHGDGSYFVDLKVPYTPEGQEPREIKYKFVVDGTWSVAEDQEVQDDGTGNTNNVFRVPNAPVIAKSDAPMQAASAPPPAAEEEQDAKKVKTVEVIRSQEEVANSGHTETETVLDKSTAIPGSESATIESDPATIDKKFSEHANDANEKLAEGEESALANAGSGAEQDIPKTLEQLFSGGDANGSSNGGQPFQTFNYSHFQNMKYLAITQHQYPSRYLLQGEQPAPDAQLTPTDVQIATEIQLHRLSAAASKSAEPGIPKMLAKIKENHPGWVFSEKRLRKLLKDSDAMSEGDRIVRLAVLPNLQGGQDLLVPVSKMDWRLVVELDGPNAVPSSVSEPSKGTSLKEIEPSTVEGEEKPSGSGGKKKGSGKNKKKGDKAAVEVVQEHGSKKTTGTPTDPTIPTPDLPPRPHPARQESASQVPSAESQDPTQQISLKWFDDIKGRGVVAKKDFKKGTVIFREDAALFAPTKTIQSAINEGQGCGYCGKLFLGKATSLITPCTAHEGISASKSKVPQKLNGKKSSSALAKKKTDGAAPPAEEAEKKPKCNLKFCTKLCKEKCNESYGPLLCSIVNPSYAALLSWAEAVDPKNGKQNTIGVFKLYLRLIVTSLRDGFPLPANPALEDEATGKELLERLECLAAVNERSRRLKENGVLGELQFSSDWLDGHRLVLEALQLPDKYYEPKPLPDLSDDDSAAHPLKEALVEMKKEVQSGSSGPPHPGKSLQRSTALPPWLKDAELPQELADKILGFDNFLVWLGRVALNQEDDGGIYLLHPCLNHDCDANAIVKRTPSLTNIGAREAKPSRIFVVAAKDIAAGEEITIAYVSPQAHVEVRRNVLRTAYLFDCSCKKCENQLAAMQVASTEATEDSESKQKEEEMLREEPQAPAGIENPTSE